MNDSSDNAVNDSDQVHTPKKAERDPRNVSTIVFPYNDLNDGLTIVKAISEKGGGVSCSPELLAAAMGQPPRSGTFRLKVSAARIFGLVGTSPGKIEITALGFEALDPARQRAARVKSFLTVPLYKRVYEDFKGKPLPPRPAAFELMLERLGVSPKQKDKARGALDRSAQAAGFYDHGRERLVMPNVDGASQPMTPHHDAGPIEAEQPNRTGGGSGGSSGSGGGDDGRRHPFIQGLLRTLPEPETTWTIEGRAKWLQAAANIFDLMYKGDGQITVNSSPTERGQ